MIILTFGNGRPETRLTAMDIPSPGMVTEPHLIPKAIPTPVTAHPAYDKIRQPHIQVYQPSEHEIHQYSIGADSPLRHRTVTAGHGKRQRQQRNHAAPQVRMHAKRHTKSHQPQRNAATENLEKRRLSSQMLPRYFARRGFNFKICCKIFAINKNYYLLCLRNKERRTRS